ncbi:MAG: galactokinase [Erysipelotrichaceae bacterium]|nr:galactokinase [Erysipelotrichaceae bacterium]
MKIRNDESLKQFIRKELSRDSVTEIPRYEKLYERARALYGDGEYRLFSAPGRSELIGNHTDHQLGRVMAAAVNIDSLAWAKKTDEPLIRIDSEGFAIAPVDLKETAVKADEKNTTESLIRGMAVIFEEEGYKSGGFDAAVTSEVLPGSGISSSASFEILVGEIINHLYNDGKVDPVTVAQIAQKAENRFFGKPCGLMDQCAIACGGLVYIDFYDPERPEVEKLDFDFGEYGYELVLTDSKADHSKLSDEYGKMPGEMKMVAGALGCEVLSRTSEEEFARKLPELKKQLKNDRALLRAYHFFTENDRVVRAKKCVETKDCAGLLSCIRESGLSSYRYLQNVFVPSAGVSEDYALAIMRSEQLLGDKGVTRVHGGGLGGTIQAFVPKAMLEEYAQGMRALFGEDSVKILQVRRAGGIEIPAVPEADK